MGLFMVGSFLCGIAQSMGQLIAARAVQGFGGGAIMALAFAILGDILPPRERGRYIGYFTLHLRRRRLLGGFIGGFIIDHWTWPWIFFINIPLAGLATMVSYYAAPAVPTSQGPSRLHQHAAAVAEHRDVDDRVGGGWWR